jgi:flagellar protein FliS
MSHQQYKKTSISTANRGQILLLLYEGAINHLKKAIQALSDQDLAKKGEHVSKAHAIINELLNTLDHEVGGKVAADLDGLYNFMIRQIIEGNMHNKPEPFLATVKLLETLLEGWRVAVAEFNKPAGEKP